MLMTISTGNEFRSILSNTSEKQVSQYKEEQKLQNYQECVDFIESQLGISLPDPDLHTSLKDGVLLCQLVNKLKPDSVKKISNKNIPFFKMANIGNFLKAAKELGLQDSDLFQTVDLYEAKNMTSVILAILTLSRKVCQVPMPKQTPSERERRRTLTSPLSSSDVFLNEAQSPPQPKPKPPVRTLPLTPLESDSSIKSETKSQHSINSINSSRRVSEYQKRLALTQAPTASQMGTIRARNQAIKSSESISDSSRKSPLSSSSSVELNLKKSQETTGSNNSSSSNVSSKIRNLRLFFDSSSKKPSNIPPTIPTNHILKPVLAPETHKKSNSTPVVYTTPKSSFSVPEPIPKARTHISRVNTIEKPRLTLPLDLEPIEPDSLDNLTTSEDMDDIPQSSAFEDSDISFVTSPTENISEEPPIAQPLAPVEELEHTIKKIVPAHPKQSVLRLDTIDWNLDDLDDDDESFHYNQSIRTNSTIRSILKNHYDGSVKSTELGRNHSLNSQGTQRSYTSSLSKSISNPHPVRSSIISPPRVSSLLISQPIPLTLSTPNLSTLELEDDDSPPSSSTTNMKRQHSRHYSHQVSTQHTQKLMESRPRADSDSNKTTMPSNLLNKRERLSLFMDQSRLMSEYQLGDCIGKGQFGSVHKALNLETGHVMAVKRINLADRDQNETDGLMMEVELLKSLSHPRIVKYEGSLRSDGYLNIIMEYVENGSLLHTLKSFNPFPEPLVASYVIQILEGLMYLHDKQVVHCDLKAANILTTKNGTVKLTDFGVSLNLEVKNSDLGEIVAGTPYWMAPEVIEMRGASTASDIWSLGCTIIELYTGKPPYIEMLPMTALFHIVEDDCPPLPEGISENLADFLRSCFRKEPMDRPTAEQLLFHAWIIESRLNQEVNQKLSRQMDESLKIKARDSQLMDSICESYNTITDPSMLSDPSPTTLSRLPLEAYERREHQFVKSSFGKAMTCKVCQDTVKKNALFCDDCGIICHVKCAINIPIDCLSRSHQELNIYSTQLQNNRRQVKKPVAVNRSAPRRPANRRPIIPPAASDSMVIGRENNKNSQTTTPFSSHNGQSNLHARKQQARRKKDDDCRLS